MIDNPPLSPPRHRKKRRRKHHGWARWRRWGLRLLVVLFIVVAASFAYWMAEHVNQRSAPDEGGLLLIRDATLT